MACAHVGLVAAVEKDGRARAPVVRVEEDALTEGSRLSIIEVVQPLRVPLERRVSDARVTGGWKHVRLAREKAEPAARRWEAE